MDKTAFFQLSYGLYLVTCAGEGKVNACVINTAAQVTDTPARMSVTVSKNNYTAKLLERAERFSVSVLSADTEMPVIARFGFQSGADVDKFDDFEYKINENNVPYVKESCVAAFFLKKESVVDVGTHVIFIASVEDALNWSGKPLTYSDYHTKKKGSTPKNAPSYQPETPPKGYRCNICNYVSETEELPAGFKCPVCGKDASYFQKI